jgi:hypothetical protein
MKYFIGIVLMFSYVIGSAQCLEGDCENGYGKYSCDCGYVYEGDFKDGQKVRGTLTKKDLVYTGEFTNDLAEGFGVMKYKDGSWFEGTFKSNAPDGYGTYYFANGQKYVGEVVAGSFEGLGIQISKDRDGRITETQIGNFLNDQLHGLGCSISYNNDIYFGEFSKGNFFGFGLYIFSDLNTAEAGEFNKKKLHNDAIMLDYPTPGFFGVKGYIVDTLQFNLSGNVAGTNLLLNVIGTGKEQMFFHFDINTKMLFTSKLGSPLIGKAIDFDGNIYEAKFAPDSEEKISILKQLYIKE